MKVIFFGTRYTGLKCLQALLDSRHQICCVTAMDYKMDEVRLADFQDLCSPLSIPFFSEDKLENEDCRQRYASYEADIGICVGWRFLVREKMISTCRLGFIGPHGADLPKYRGFASTHWAILNGDPEMGLCIMRYNDGTADDGRIVCRKLVPLNQSTSIGDLMKILGKLIPELVLKALDVLEADQSAGKVQDETRMILSYPRLPGDGEIDWHKPALAIDRLIRAVTRPYPGAYTFFNGRKMYIWKARVKRHPPQWVGEHGHVVLIDGEVAVLTGEGMLVLEECQFDGEAPFSAAGYFESYRLRLGLNHSKEIMELKKRVSQLEAKLK